jgi:hypothetical protein
VESIRIVLIFLGWLLLIYLSNRTLRRGEISRLKDRVVDSITGIQEWLIEELQTNPSKDMEQVEALLSAKATQLELKIKQLNHYIGIEVLQVVNVAKIRGVDLFSVNTGALVVEVNDVFFDVIEHIETVYDDHYFKLNPILRFWRVRKYELCGAGISMAILFFFFGIFHRFF